MVAKSKYRKLSWTTLLSVILALLPTLLEILNDEAASKTVFVELDYNNNTGRINSSIVADQHASEGSKFKTFTRTQK